MRKIVSILVLLLFTGAVSLVKAQDVITKKDGSEIRAKVVEKDNSTVRYKLYDNPSGPTYVVEKSELFMIKYEGGRKELFVPSTGSAESQATSSAESQATSSTANTAANTAAPSSPPSEAPSAPPFESRRPVTASTYSPQPPSSSSPVYQGNWKSQMQVKAPDIYRKYQKNSRLAGFGLGLVAGGVTAIVVGVATGEKTTTTTATSVQVQVKGTGGAIAAAGTVCVLAGTPMMIVGFSKRSKAKREYLNNPDYSQTYRSPLQSPHLEVYPNGLAFVF
ncbi:MAG: hypothetical protein LBC19_11505 [Tannerella sp.]|nr:hypothetical protein [Tannerella sp.]